MNIIDLHCDTILKLWEVNGRAGLRSNSYSIDVDKLLAGGALAQFFAVFIDQKQHVDSFLAFQQMTSLFYAEIEKNSGTLGFAGSAAELVQNHEKGLISAFLTIEEGGVLAGRLERLAEVYHMGVRLITLTWNYPNEIGYPNSNWQYQHQGLTPFGAELVGEMNRLGMLIDVSHLSDQGFFDVARLSSQPFIASHSNARAIQAHSRNLTDEMIKVVAEKGGVIGLNFCGAFLGPDETSRVEDMVKHVLHILRVGGSDVIALGTDFDGIDSELEIKDIGQVPILADALSRAGLKASELDKFLWQNALRVIRDVLG